MKAAIVEKIFWVLTASALGFAAGGSWRPAGQVISSLQPRRASLPVPRKVDRKQLRSYAESVVSRDPFRLTRRPPAVAFGAAVPNPQLAAPRPPKPALRLAGIIGGPPWQAILEGLPAHAGGVVVSAGEQVGEFRIGRVTRDTIIVRGSDTTWILTLNRGSQ